MASNDGNPNPNVSHTTASIARFFVSAIVLLLILDPLAAAEPEVAADQMPRVPPTPPERALDTFSPVLVGHR